MQVAGYWCRQHGRRVTALVDAAGRYRYDAARAQRRGLCDALLDAPRGPPDGPVSIRQVGAQAGQEGADDGDHS
jgi:hypothetical protein